MQTNGRMPLRYPQQGRMILPGNSSNFTWKGYVPKGQVPQVLNPPRGFVSSANQRTADLDYPYYIGGGFADYRGRYLNRRLAEMTAITVDDMKALQYDNHDLLAEEALPAMLALLDSARLSSLEEVQLKRLENWNYKFDIEETAPIIFEEWWKNFLTLAWDEWSVHGDRQQVFYPEVWRTVEFLQDKVDIPYWDIQETDKKETLTDLVTQSYQAAVADLEEGLMSNDFTWGKEQGLFIGHLARIPGFGRDKVVAGGSFRALNANTPGVGPSWRMVVELGDEVNAWGVYPGGQSGHPSSPYFDDAVDTWAAGEYFKLNFPKSKEDALSIQQKRTTFLKQ